jgi:hypothetical protein
MATNYKVLGQSNPAATTNTTLYTCGTANGAVGSTLTVCNLGTASTYVNLAVRPAGATLANSQYVVYQAPVSSNDTLFFTLGIALANTDVVTCYANTANISFSLFGSEIT